MMDAYFRLVIECCQSDRHPSDTLTGRCSDALSQMYHTCHKMRRPLCCSMIAHSSGAIDGHVPWHRRSRIHLIGNLQCNGTALKAALASDKLHETGKSHPKLPC